MNDFDDDIERDRLFCVNNAKCFALNYQSFRNSPVPEEYINETIWKDIEYLFPNIDNTLKEALYSQIKHDVDTTIEETNRKGSCLEDKASDHLDWLDKAKKDENIKWDHWLFYKKLLLSKKTLESKIIAEKVNTETNIILGLLEDPNRLGAWDRRGLVVGEVQAGKTSNYIGLIAKAIDSGYKIIIVLAGLTNDLRVQTQERVDDGLLGYRSDRKGNNGFVQKCNGKTIVTRTSCDSKGDYKSTPVFNTLNLEECVLFVVKKNASVLRNILLELYKELENSHSNLIEDIPLLMIDDEADNASTDTNVPTIDSLTKEKIDDADVDPTMINRYIRAILSCFAKSSYVGYTATPYANIFEYPEHGKEKVVYDIKLGRDITVGEDLFPRSFIYKMSSPSNYVGIDKFFGTEEDASDALPVAIRVDEIFPGDFIENNTCSKRKVRKIILREKPESLKYAILCFIIASIIKDIRVTRVKHNTMLVHVDRLTKKQSEIHEWVSEFIEELRELFTIEKKQKQRKFLNYMKYIWETEFDSKLDDIKQKVNSNLYMSHIKWKEIENRIPSFIKHVECKTVNGKTLDALNYREHKEGFNVIAIGGDKLARGLTLEGLTISYFLRLAGTYDALTQMGRWFGYRDGYIDVCRVFTLTETYNNFQEISVAVHDMYEQFDDLCKQPNRTPLDYGLRILTNPKSRIMITSKTKSKGAIKHSVSFSGSPVPTAYLPVDKQVNENNSKIMNDFIDVLGFPSGCGSSIREKGEGNNYYWTDVSADIIIKYFLETSFVLDKQNAWFTLKEISEYVKKTIDKYSELKRWTVVVMNGSYSLSPKECFGKHAKVKPSIRSLEQMSNNQGYYELNRRRITSGSDEAFDLSIEQYENALRQTNEERTRFGKEKTDTPSPHCIRTNRSKETALLLLYPLKLKKIDGSYVDEIVPGFMISFPELGHRELEKSFWANIVYEHNSRTTSEVIRSND